MKCWFTNKKSETGIALVITLVMLAVVTVMAIVFLAVTRRERSSVKVTEETAMAKDMADAAFERAKTEAIATMNATDSKLHYDLFNSRTFYNPNGFQASDGATNANVGPVWLWPEVRRNSEKNYLQLLANLQYDPAVPVFIETNRNRSSDFRFYLDFNRNRQFETNGMLFSYDSSYRPIVDQINGQRVTNISRFVGDPEWIGVLEKPDLPHSETNRFVGRLAYLALPAGKTLDLNFIHNQVNPADQLNQANAVNGFSRSQGVGSWEINLAAFLRELNTNNYAWGANNAYRFILRPNAPFQASGAAFDNARALLAFRYPQRDYLKSIKESLGDDNILNPIFQPGPFNQVFRNNHVFEFGDRPYLGGPQQRDIFFAANQPPREFDDNVTRKGWPGSLNTNAFTDLQQLFSLQASSQDFTNRLQDAMSFGGTGISQNSGKSSYDRYTLYRLASQLGTDSTPATEGRIHLNFKNPVGMITNTVERWSDDPENNILFFTNAADLMLRASIDNLVIISNSTQEAFYGRPMLPDPEQPTRLLPTPYYLIGDTLVRTNFSMSNIQVYATHPRVRGVIMNEYTPTIHRILQVAANICDTMTNRAQNLPSVFMPVFTKTPTNISISQFVQVTNNAPSYLARVWTNFQAVATNGTPIGSLSRLNFYGQHMVIGARKGHPNFNELALNSRVELSRKLSLTRSSATATNIVSTNQMFLVGLEQRWGMEAWNSYASNYNRSLTVTGEVVSSVALWDGTNSLSPATNFVRGMANRITTTNNWRGRGTVTADRNMLIVLDQTLPLLQDIGYGRDNLADIRRFRGTNEANYSALLDTPPEFVLRTTNSVKFWMLTDDGNLIDFVSFDNLVTQMDLREELRRNEHSVTGGASQNRVSYWDPTPVNGGPLTVGVTNQLAASLGELEEPNWNPYRYNSPDKRGGISKFRLFVGLPLRTGIDTNINPNQAQGLRQQAPYTPTRQMIQRITWQANDPLVHYMIGDLRRNRQDERPETFNGMGRATNQWNIGQRNNWYHPWGGADDVKQDPFSWNVGLMDPGVRSSDSWDFLPRLTNFTHYPNIGYLGQVHRGTPWQTLYLKSFYRQNPTNGAVELFAPPSLWYDWAGGVGNHPPRDWRLLDVFTTAPNDNAARGLLSVNQTNTAAWSAVLSGTVVARSAMSHNQLLPLRNSGAPPAQAFQADLIQPGGPEITEIVRSINHARTNQFRIVPNPDLNANPNEPYKAVWITNRFGGLYDVFNHMGAVLAAPALSVQNPYLRRDQLQVQAAWNDRAVEFIPQQILSLLRRDEPRFVVYAFGQSLKPAPRSLTSDPSFYHMCTNYQITGEVITKTTFRVEGQPLNEQNPLKAVVEKYEILPPSE